MSKLNTFSALPENIGVLLFSFSFGLFFGLLPLIIGRPLGVRIPATLENSLYISVISGAAFLLPGYVWHRRRMSPGRISRDFSILLWGLMRVVAVYAMAGFVYVPRWGDGSVYKAIGWSTAPDLFSISVGFAYGCFLGFLANYLLRSRLRDLVIILLVTGFAFEVVLGHNATKYSYGRRVDPHKMERLAKKGGIDHLIEYLDHVQPQTRSSVKKAILSMDTSITLPALIERLTIKKGNRYHDYDVRSHVIDVLGMIGDERRTHSLRDAYDAIENRNDKRLILDLLRGKSGRKDLVPFLIDELDTEDDMILGTAIRRLEEITGVAFGDLRDDVHSRVDRCRKWWESNKDQFLEDIE